MCAGGGKILSLGGWISGAYSVFQWENYWHPEWGGTILFTAGHLASLAILLWISGPLPFWHQGPVLWKTAFPQTNVVGRMVSGWFKHSYDSKESACNARDAALIPGSGRSPGGGNGYPLQYSCLRNPVDKEPWLATVHEVAKELDTAEWLNNNQI